MKRKRRKTDVVKHTEYDLFWGSERMGVEKQWIWGDFEIDGELQLTSCATAVGDSWKMGILLQPTQHIL